MMQMKFSSLDFNNSKFCYAESDLKLQWPHHICFIIVLPVQCSLWTCRETVCFGAHAGQMWIKFKLKVGVCDSSEPIAPVGKRPLNITDSWIPSCTCD